MATPVYVLCAASSLVCALLLVRAYRASRTRFLLLSSLCFCGLALANILMVLDLLVIPGDLMVARQLCTFLSVLVLVWGFIWETR